MSSRRRIAGTTVQLPFEGGLGLSRPRLAAGRCRRLAPLTNQHLHLLKRLRRTRLIHGYRLSGLLPGLTDLDDHAIIADSLQVSLLEGMHVRRRGACPLRSRPDCGSWKGGLEAQEHYAKRGRARQPAARAGACSIWVCRRAPIEVVFDCTADVPKADGSTGHAGAPCSGSATERLTWPARVRRDPAA
jgi:hypothetical protein